MTASAMLILQLSLISQQGPKQPNALNQPQPLTTVVRAWEEQQARFTGVSFSWVSEYVNTKGSNMPATAPKSINPSGKDDPPEDEILYEEHTLLLADPGWIRHKSIRRKGLLAAAIVKEDFDSAYDGTLVQGLSRPNDRFSFPSGTYSKLSEFLEPKLLEIRPLLTAYRPFDPLLATFRREDLRLLNGAFVHEGQECTAIEVVQSGRRSGVRQLWADPNRSYSVVRDLLNDERGVLKNETVILYEQDRDWGWYPAKWRTTELWPNGSTRFTWTSKLTEKHFGLKLTRSDFRVHFPVGTRVVDTRGPSEVSYIVKEDDSVRAIQPDERGLPHDVLVATETGMALAPAKGYRKWALPLILTTACVFGVARRTHLKRKERDA